MLFTMKNVLFILISLLSACSTSEKQDRKKESVNLDSVKLDTVIQVKVTETEPKEERLIYWYIYSKDSKEPSDSLGWYETNIEKSLALYNDVEQLSKTVHNIGLHLSIFKLENEKFAIVANSTEGNIYKFIDGKYQKIYSTEALAGFMDILVRKMDINKDGYKDALVEVETGGSYGKGYLFLFYNAEEKSIEYDDTTELRNVELDVDKQKVLCSYKIISRLYKIEKFDFRVMEETEYLVFTTGEKFLEDKKEITKYDTAGNIISIDTVCVE